MKFKVMTQKKNQTWNTKIEADKGVVADKWVLFPDWLKLATHLKMYFLELESPLLRNKHSIAMIAIIL